MLEHIFFAHEAMVQNTKRLRQVLVIDATYKTNNLLECLSDIRSWSS